jgi:hypothetical protein
MSILTLLIVSAVVLFVLLVIVIVLAVWDWQAWLRRKFGNNYVHGLAHINFGGQWVYRESELWYKGDDAMSYIRKLDVPDVNGKNFTADIVPASIGFDYNQNTGRRVYRIQPGGTVATSDNTDHPVTDYPSELISVHIIDRTATKYIQTVSGKKASSAGIIAIVVLFLLVIIAGGIFITTKNKPAPAQPPAATANATAPAGDPAPGLQFEAGSN